MADDIHPELQRQIEALERKNKLLEEGLHQAERLRQMFGRTTQEFTASKSLLIRQATELEEKAREFKLVMETLTVSEKRFRMAFQNAAIGMALVGLDGHWIKVNNSLCQIVGYSEPELLKKTFHDITHPDDQKTDIDLVAKLLARELDHYQMEKRYFHKDGHVVWIRVSVSLIRDAKDNPIYFVSQTEDITEGKLAAEAVRRANVELSLFRKLLDNSSDAIEVLDPITLRFLDVNEKACRDLGYSREKLLSMSAFDIDPGISADSRKMIEAQIQKSGTARFEGIHRRKDGSTFPVEVSATAIEIDKPYMLSIARDITERKKLELDREQYLRFFMLSINPMCIADPYGCLKQVNPAFVRLTGYSESELKAKPFIEFVLQEDRQRTGDEMKLQVESRPTLHFDNRYLCKNGTVIDLSWTAYYDRHDGISYATAIDITERKQMEETLKNMAANLQQETANLHERTARLTEAQHIAHLGSWEWDVVNNTVIWSDETYRIFGLEPQQIIATFENYIQATHPDDRQYVENNIRESLELAQPYSMDHRILLPDRTVRYVQERIEAVRNDEGQLVKLLGTTQDITERKHAEDALQKSEEQYRRIVETAQEGIWIIDANNKTTFANNKIAELLGYTVEEMHGMSLFDFMDEAGKAISAVNVERRRQGITEQHDFKLQRKDGTDLWVIMETNPMVNEGGEYVGALAMITDITARVRSQSQLLEQLDELRRWHEVTSGREARILDLKHEVNDLLIQTGKDPRYPSAE